MSVSFVVKIEQEDSDVDYEFTAASLDEVKATIAGFIAANDTGTAVSGMPVNAADDTSVEIEQMPYGIEEEFEVETLAQIAAEIDEVADHFITNTAITIDYTDLCVLTHDDDGPCDPNFYCKICTESIVCHGDIDMLNESVSKPVAAGEIKDVDGAIIAAIKSLRDDMLAVLVAFDFDLQSALSVAAGHNLAAYQTLEARWPQITPDDRIDHMNVAISEKRL